MRSDKSKNSDEQFYSLLRSVNRDAVAPDREFLRQLQERSAKEFEAEVRSGSASPQESTNRILVWRVIMKSRMTKLAAAAVIIVAVIGGIHEFGGLTDGASAAFAEIVRPVLTAYTASFDVALESGNQPVQRSRFQCIAPALIKQTMSDGTTIIVDYQQHKALTLNPNDMTANLTWLVPRKDVGVCDILGQMQQRIARAISLSDESIERLGRRSIDGRDAIGFQVELSGEQDYVIGWQGRGTFTVWADPDTKHPIRLEWYDDSTGINSVATNMELNVDLDEAMFSMRIPEGYTLTEVEEEPKALPSTVDEQKIINAFRQWVDLSGGTFPSSVAGYSLIKDLDPNADISFIQKEWKGFHGFVHVNMPSLKAFLKVMELMSSGGLIGPMPEGTDWDYVGKGVKFGDADRPIFWYRPEDSKTYRVIYGDLSVKGVAPENLPK
jgi:hypothetical protein